MIIPQRSYPKKQDGKLSSIMNTNFTIMTRKKFTSKFKAKVVLESLKERCTLHNDFNRVGRGITSPPSHTTQHTLVLGGFKLIVKQFMV